MATMIKRNKGPYRLLTVNELPSLRAIAFVFLTAFCFVLPIAEAPKNIFGICAIGFALWWRLTASYTRSHGAEKRSFELHAICFLLGLTALCAGIGNSDYKTDYFWQGLDWLLLPTVASAWIALCPDERRYRHLLRAIVLGTTVAILYGLWTWSGTYPKLPSVGHVNQSAMYAVFGVLCALCLIAIGKCWVDRLLGILTCLLAIYYIGPSRSLVAFGGLVFVIVFICGVWALNQRSLSAKIGVSLCFFMLAGFATLPSTAIGVYAELRNEMVHRWYSESDPFSQRDRLVAAAWLVGSHHVFGFGVNAFKDATDPDVLRGYTERQNRDWAAESGKYFSSGHGHNLFATLLVERGWFGVGIIYGCLIWIFWRLAPKVVRGEPAAMIGLGSLILVVLMGLGQTTLHVEHGQLALLLMMSGIFSRMRDPRE